MTQHFIYNETIKSKDLFSKNFDFFPKKSFNSKKKILRNSKPLFILPCPAGKKKIEIK